MGTTWTLAIACMAYGMGGLRLPVSIIAPLTNSNALIAFLVGAMAISEWRNLNLPLVALGTLLICSGATAAVRICAAVAESSQREPKSDADHGLAGTRKIFKIWKAARDGIASLTV